MLKGDLTCSMIINPGDDYDLVCGKPARRTILDTEEGCCDDCFEEMIPGSLARQEAEIEYPLVEDR